MNVFCVNTAAVLTLVALGDRPESFSFERTTTVSRSRLVTAFLLSIVFVGVVLGAAVASVQHVHYDQQVNAAVHETLTSEAYVALAVADVRIGFAGVSYLPARREVTVTLVAPAGHRYPSLPEDLATAIYRRTGTITTVHVRYVNQATTATMAT